MLFDLKGAKKINTTIVIEGKNSKEDSTEQYSGCKIVVVKRQSKVEKNIENIGVIISLVFTI